MVNFFSKIRSRLILLVLLAIVPALVLTLYTGFEQRRVAATQAKKEALSLAHFVSSRQRQFVEGTHQFLYLLAQLSPVRRSDPAICSDLFANILNKYPHYLNLGAAGLDGFVFASAIPLSKPINVADRPYFQRALKEQKFTIGEYQIGRITGKPGVNLGYPVIDDTGKVKAVVYVVLDLEWLNQFTLQTDLPKNSVLSLVDSDSTILARYPGPNIWIGKTMPESSIVKTILTQGEGMIETTGVDGVRRLYALTSFGSTVNQADKIYVSVGIPTSEAFAQVNKMLTWNLVSLLFIALLSLSAAWFLGDLLVLRRLNPVVNAAKRLGAGDLSARTGLSCGKGELSQLASTFDQMAVSLETHETGSKKMEEEHRKRNQMLEMASISANVVLWDWDLESNSVGWSNNIDGMLGYGTNEFPRNLQAREEIIHPLDKQDVMEKLSAHLGYRKPYKTEYRVRKKDGSFIWWHDEGQAIWDKDGKAYWMYGASVDINERKRAEEALRRSEEHYRSLFENMLNGYSYCRILYEEGTPQDFIYLDVNPAFEKLTGLKDVLGRKVTEVIPGIRQGNPELFEIYGRVALTGEPEKFETYLDSLGIWFSITVYSYGKEYFTAIFDNITERKRAEEALGASEERYRTLFEGAGEGILVADIESKQFKYANPAICRMLGYTAEELTQLGVADLHPKEALDHVVAEFEAQARGEKILSPEIPCLRKDGSVIYTSIATAPVVIDGRKCNVGFFTDITERNRAEEELRKHREHLEELVEERTAELTKSNERLEKEITEHKRTGQALRESEARFRMAAESVSDLIWEWDIVRGEVVWFGKIDEMLGYGPGEFPRTLEAWEKVIHPDDHGRVMTILDQHLQTRKPYLEEYRVFKKDGSILYWIDSGTALWDEEGKAYKMIGAVSDITKRKRVEEEIKKLNEDLKLRAKELEAINRELEAFSYSVSHDLRAPLRSIDGFSQVLLEDYSDKLDEEGKSSLQRVRAGSQRMAQLIDDLLKLSRVTRGEMRQGMVDLSSMAKAALTEFQKTEPERQVECVVAEGVISNGDGRLLRVVLENLLANAWKFTVKRSQARIEFGTTQGDGQNIYFIRDNGAGFDMSFSDKLFGAFQRLHGTNEFPGTGIGLATVQRIIHRHGGRVWAEGEVEKGATFYFTLP